MATGRITYFPDARVDMSYSSLTKNGDKRKILTLYHKAVFVQFVFKSMGNNIVDIVDTIHWVTPTENNTWNFIGESFIDRHERKRDYDVVLNNVFEMFFYHYKNKTWE